MKAARFHTYGGPDVLQIDDVPVPRASAGQVVIKVAATSFNPVDAAIRGGVFREMLPLQLPATPGLDVSGVVTEVGDGVEGFPLGTAVVGYLPRTAPGAAAEYVAAPIAALTVAPSSVPLEDAAALPLVGLTAWQAVFEQGLLQAGQRVLINGAGGAVGGYAVQLAVGAGADVIATASPASLERVRSYRPTEVFDHTSTTLRSAVPVPVDLVINAAATPFAELLAVTRPGGRVVSVASPVDADNDRDVTAIRMASRSDAGQLARLVAEVDHGAIHIWVADRRPLEAIAAVHAAPHGKTVIFPG